VVVSVPRGEGAQLKTQLVRTDPLIAPLTQGQNVGTLKVLSGTRVVSEIPVTVLEPVEQAGMFGRAWDTLRLWMR
jgi:D-alanyl-D-alanine carboxypeptidase (penicillin-binding protein 5/6)